MAQKIKFDEIRNYSEIAYKFLSQFKKGELPLDRYDLGNNLFINVESYETKDRRTRRFEVHKKYIDIQCILEGEEIIEISDKDMILVNKYDENRDIAFYRSYTKGEEFRMKEGECLVIPQNEIHMPCLISDTKSTVKKAVIKVPYKPENEIKYLVMDVDGTLTDGRLYIGNNGEEYKAFNIKDGQGIVDAIKKGIVPVIITGKNSNIVMERSRQLGIKEIHQGVKDKLEKLNEIVDDISQVIYIGDDSNDLECMKAIKKAGGLVACPADAIDEVKEIADYVSNKKGGKGAVREILEWL